MISVTMTWYISSSCYSNSTFIRDCHHFHLYASVSVHIHLGSPSSRGCALIRTQGGRPPVTTSFGKKGRVNLDDQIFRYSIVVAESYCQHSHWDQTDVQIIPCIMFIVWEINTNNILISRVFVCHSAMVSGIL